MVSRSYRWDVADWSTLEATIPHEWDNMIGEEDVDRFVTEAIVLASLSTGISLQELVEKNNEFYAEKKQLFENYEFVSEDNPYLMRIQQLFMVPVAARID